MRHEHAALRRCVHLSCHREKTRLRNPTAFARRARAAGAAAAAVAGAAALVGLLHVELSDRAQLPAAAVARVPSQVRPHRHGRVRGAAGNWGECVVPMDDVGGDLLKPWLCDAGGCWQEIWMYRAQDYYFKGKRVLHTRLQRADAACPGSHFTAGKHAAQTTPDSSPLRRKHTPRWRTRRGT